MDRKEWYVVFTRSGKEEQVKKYIEEKYADDGRVGRVVVPYEEVVEEGKTKKPKKLFPRYVFVEMEPRYDVFSFIRSLPDVIGIIGDPEEPQPLTEEEVENILRKVGAAKEVVSLEFGVEDKVKITKGPFKDYIGVVASINLEKRKVKVLVPIFGRETPVEVDFEDVQKMPEGPS
jgi:transcriptional antiterminator NusG